MNLCLNAFVLQFSDGLLDTCSVTAARALLLPYAHRRHCKDEDSYKECWSHVEFSISLTRKRMEPAGSGATWTGSPKGVFTERKHHKPRQSLNNNTAGVREHEEANQTRKTRNRKESQGVEA